MIPGMPQAVIFDFDGVLFDTEPLHYRAFAELLSGRGMEVDRGDYFARHLGRNDASILETLFAEAGQRLDSALQRELLAEKFEIYRGMIADGLPMLPGAAALVRGAARCWPLAICSGAKRPEIEHLLATAGMLPHFPIIVTSDEVATSKPDPAGYLLTLERLRADRPELTADACLVIEDSVQGITAARRAGMRVLAVASHPAAETLSAAHRVVSSLADITVNDLTNV